MKFRLQHLTDQQLVGIALPALALALFVWLTWPAWHWLWGEWRGNDYYSHGTLIIPVSLYLAWRRWQPAPTLGTGHYGGLGLLILSIGLFFYLLGQKVFYLAALALLPVLAALIWALYGSAFLKRLAFPVLFLVLMVPLPFIERATLPLALWTGLCSGNIVQWLGVDITVTGAAVSLPNTTLTIGAQCSGINSIISLITLSVLTAYILQGPLWGRLALIGMAIPLAILGNVLRVANLLIVARYWGGDAAFRFYHDFSGPIFFVVVLLLLLLLTRLFQCKTLRFEVV
jgi:exosortase